MSYILWKCDFHVNQNLYIFIVYISMKSARGVQEYHRSKAMTFILCPFNRNIDTFSVLSQEAFWIEQSLTNCL